MPAKRGGGELVALGLDRAETAVHNQVVSASSLFRPRWAAFPGSRPTGFLLRRLFKLGSRTMRRRVEIHGHRGARGLRPENTLPAFELALDLGVTALELDLHLTNDGIPVVCHDPRLSPRLARRAPGVDSSEIPDSAALPAIAGMTYRQLKHYLVDRNPEPRRFPEQRAVAGALAQWFAEQYHLPPFAIPTLGDVFEFVSAYAGQPGEKVGKPEDKRQRAASVIFNIELKRDPKRPENIPDRFDGQQPGHFEQAVWETINKHRVQRRCIIQCFDWRVLRIFHAFDASLALSALLDSAPPADLTEQLNLVKATIYSPNHQRLTEPLTKAVQQSGKRVIPYTINEESRMATLLDWGVVGIITDFPDRLLRLVQSRHLDY